MHVLLLTTVCLFYLWLTRRDGCNRWVLTGINLAKSYHPGQTTYDENI
jgi:hypothetical protein